MNGWVSIDDDERSLSLAETLADQRVSAEHEVVYKDMSDKLLESLGVLTPSERSVFVLRDIQDLDVKEIAKIHEISQVTVRRHLSSARQKLRVVLKKLRMNVSESRPVS